MAWRFVLVALLLTLVGAARMPWLHQPLAHVTAPAAAVVDDGEPDWLFAHEPAPLLVALPVVLLLVVVLPAVLPRRSFVRVATRSRAPPAG